MNLKKNNKEILSTLGPASRNERVIKRLEEVGINVFRINLSHTKIKDLRNVIDEIKAHTSVPICLDTEGAQVRTGDLKEFKINIETNSVVRILKQDIKGDAQGFSLYPYYIIDYLEIGDLISIDFNSVLIQVMDKDENGVNARVLTGGVLGQNKAVTVDRELNMPPLTEKDHEALKIGREMGVKHVALSFANKGEDVDYVRSLVDLDTFIISKIESLSGIENLEAIASRSNAILIDRGDMSRQVPVEQIPRAQKEIIRRSKEYGAKVYVATNLLETMITDANPTRAEVNDVFNTLVDGADGLVLAAETAIGSYPVQCGMMVSKIIQQFEQFSNGSKFSVKYLRNRESLLINEPHGGKLVYRVNSNPDMEEIYQYKQLMVDETTVLNVEQIAVGTYSPLEGFMNQSEVQSVIKDYRLPDGSVWPLPITLQAQKDQIEDIQPGDQIALVCKNDKQIYATVRVNDVYTMDLEQMSRDIFHTDEPVHPGVKLLKDQGPFFIGGKIELIRRFPSNDKHFEMTPHQSRKIFENKGWSRIVGFHTRNVAHRVHEYLQLQAFEKYHCDGIFVHPLVGPKKSGDYTAQVILKSYEMIINKYYPENKALLAAFQSYPRYSGPREAVFTALCRKNFGCSHFIVGRDHSGVGRYYEPDAGHKLFEELGDIGITPIFFNPVHYNKKLNDYVEEGQCGEEDLVKISGTEGREMLQSKTLPPDWFMREDIANYIIREMNKGKEVFLS